MSAAQEKRKRTDEIIPDKRKLIGLVEQADDGRLCLPDFQRDFIWTREAVADILRSVLRCYYIGSLLLLRCDPTRPPFAPKLLRGARATSAKPDLLVLDGQQRLTSLLYALTAPKLRLKDSKRRRYFFVDLEILGSKPDEEGIVFDRTENELDGLDKSTVQYQRKVLPCTKLLRTDDFMHWRDGMDDWLRDYDSDAHKRYRQHDREVWSKAVSAFQSFEVPLVELPMVDEDDPGSIGRVCAIFEKLNSTGVDLSVYDLLTARLYRCGIVLHDLWSESCSTHERLKRWSGGKADTNKFGIIVLKALALLRDQETKPAVLIDLKPEGFEKDWRRAAAAVERAVELLELVSPDGFGVFNDKWLPGFGNISVLAALRARIEDDGLGEQARADLRRWYWSSVFLERYSSAVDSKSKKDYSELTAYWRDGTSPPEMFAEAQARLSASGYSVRVAASHSSGIYCGVFCLLAIRGARDWASAEDIQLQQLEDHHIFPKAYLKDHDLKKRAEINTIVNRTLIGRKTNGIIKKRCPSEYLSMREVIAPKRGLDVLKPHFIEDDALRAMQDTTPESDGSVPGTYERFLQARERSIVTEIRRVCSIEVS